MTAEKRSYSSNKMYCRECNEEIQGSFKFCTRCGSPIAENPLLKVDRDPIPSLDDDFVCPRCNSLLPPKLRFCTNCGTRIGTVAGTVIDECPKCHEKAKCGQRFCTKCGESFEKISIHYMDINSKNRIVYSKKVKNDDIKRALAIKREISSKRNDDFHEDSERKGHRLESKIFETFDEVIDATGNIIKKNLLSIGESRNRDCKGYVVCDRCNDYYRLRPWDEPDDFLGTCECGGNLRFKKEIWR